MAVNEYGEIDHWEDNFGSDEWIWARVDEKMNWDKPHDDECWFCGGDGCNNFSVEFDTPYHLECLFNAEKNTETEIMVDEYRRNE
jgi:hypothetical protein